MRWFTHRQPSGGAACTWLRRNWTWHDTGRSAARPRGHSGCLPPAGRVVADELGLPSWWLNEQASVYVAPGGDAAAPHVFDHPGLRVSAASPEHLLAMKVLAARRRDAEDISYLVKHLGLSSVAEVLAICSAVFPEEPVPDRARLILEDFSTRADARLA
jgi:hypothetical protein